MDPSCTIGFLCSNLQEFQALRREAEKVLAPPLQKGVYPFFSFSDLSLEEMLDSSVNMRLGSLAEDTLMFAEGGGRPLKGRQRRRRSKRGSDVLDGVVFCDEEDFVVVECTRPELEEEEEGGTTGSSSQGSDGEMVFLTKSDTLSSGVETSGTTTDGTPFRVSGEEMTTVGTGGGARIGETMGTTSEGITFNGSAVGDDRTHPIESTRGGGDKTTPPVTDSGDKTTPPVTDSGDSRELLDSEEILKML